MNYLAQGLDNGFRIGAEAAQRRKDREQQTALDKARRDLELERDAMRYKNEGDRQQAGFTFQSGEAEKGRGFTRDENATDRTYRTTERRGTQEFHAGESKLERDAREMADQRRLAQDAKQFSEKKALDYAQLGLSATNAQRDDERRTDPNSPEIQIRNETLTKLKRENAEAGAPLGAPTPPKPPAAALTPITSKEEYDRLPKGARFSWNGKNGVKN